MRAAWLAAVLVVAATPAASADLAFKFKPRNVAALRAYNDRPYYRMLGECAGIYGSLVGRYEAAGARTRADAAKAQGVAFARAATARLRADRGIGDQAALALIREDVESGRASGEALFRQPPPRGLRHEQVLDLFCSQVEEAHASAARFR